MSSNPTATTDAPRARGLAATFADRSIRTKILALISILAAIAVAISAVAMSAMSGIAADTKLLASLQQDISTHLSAAHQNELKARMIIAQIAAVESDADVEAWLAKQVENDAEMQGNIDGVQAGVDALIAPELMPPSWQEFVDGYAAWLAVRDAELVPAATAEGATGYPALLDTVSQPLIDAFTEPLTTFETQMTAGFVQVGEKAAAANISARRTLLIALVVGLVAVITLGFLLANTLRRPLDRVRVALVALAAGDLTVDVDVHSRDEVGQMAAALKAAQSSLRATLTGVGETAQTVAAAAEELSAANTQV
ncbi:MAG: methyl-accepting chemotaxis protein, partial [Cellulomonadaceae bacterium]|nr:methyl-accepting chemotaxis protein [Cellulomonadaceae bacterium]